MISIHPTALVASKQIGDGTRIWAFVNVLAGARIGRDCNICDRCFVENEVVLGDRVTVKCGVSLYDGITLEDDVFVGPDVAFSNDPRPRSLQHLDSHPRTRVREGASLGAGVIVLPGITIGRYAMIGAGALVTRDVPDFGLVYGSPARVHGHVCRCGKTLHFENGSAACACGRRFLLDAAGEVSEAA
ncbi:MAG TPA: acyltransferase [Thermoanaerobaculia bacterium]|jgi:acetyltransferase-like isoleucine patch superfamily enzyme